MSESDLWREIERLRKEVEQLKTIDRMQLDYICVVDQKAQNTSGGTFTSGAWRRRDLNTERADAGGYASVAGNQITLAAGIYYAHISAPAYRVQRHQAILVNATDNVTLLVGTSEFSHSTADYASNRSVIVGSFTLAASKLLEVQHKCGSTYVTQGFGIEANLGSEIYTVVELWRKM